MDPTRPTMLRWACLSAWTSEILPARGNEGRRDEMTHDLLSSYTSFTLTLLEKDVDDSGPLLPKEIGTSERTISSADDETVDSLFDKVKGSELSSLLSSD